MPEAHTMLVFVGAAIALLVTPGPAVMYVVARSMDQGVKAGIVSSLGLLAGGVVHLLAAALGLAAVIASSPSLFQVVKLAGAAYLIYLGIRRFMARGENGAGLVGKQASSTSVFRQGFIVCLLNPKSILFFFAFLPQFIDPARGGFLPQFLGLGAIFFVLAFTSDSTYAVLSAKFGNLVGRSSRLTKMQGTMSAVIYIALGLATAFFGDVA